MAKELRPSFTPDTVTPPGETLREMIEHADMTQVELAERTGLDKKTINLIARGKAPVTQETALAFEKVFGLPARFWMALESQFAEHQARAEQEQAQSKFLAWAKLFPYAEMRKRRWVPPAKSLQEKMQNLLSYFGVATLESFEAVYGEMSLSYRKSPNVRQKNELLAAWLRAGEIAANGARVTADYDEGLLLANLDRIRELTNLNEPNEIVRKIKHLCGEAGVVFVMVPELPGLGVSGVMRWPNKRPLIQQCLRFRTNDQFWFTFFHEARHVLQKRKKEIFVEGEGLKEEQADCEEDANKFAGEFLIPPSDYRDFLRGAAKPGCAQIRTFAKKIGVHPAIIVGRLQRDEVLSWSHPAKNLKVKYCWAEDP